jgi:hypothetical protein
LNTLLLVAAICVAVAWYRRTTVTLTLPPDVRQLDNRRAMARATRLFDVYQDYLEHNRPAYPEELKGATQEVRAALVLVMFERARRGETHPVMLHAARSCYAMLLDHEFGARRTRALAAPQGTSAHTEQEHEFLRSEIASGQLAKREFDTWFRSGLGALKVTPAAAGWDIPDQAEAIAREVQRDADGMFARFSNPVHSAAVIRTTPADADRSVESEHAKKAAWWRTRVASPLRERMQPVFAKLRHAVDEPRRQELDGKTEQLGLRYLEVLHRVGADRLEAERRRIVCLLIDNYRSDMISQIDDGTTMSNGVWNTVSALLAGAAALESVLLFEKHGDALEREYGPDFVLPGPPMGADLLTER